MDRLNYKTFHPETLIALPHWIFWRKENINGRETKIPYSANYEGRASSTSPDSWCDYKKAVEKFDSTKFNGLGFVFTADAGLVFIDLDDCFLSDGTLCDYAKEIISHIKEPTYCELSQSGNGLHIILRGSIPRSFKNSSAGVEMYDSKRYCAITFKALCEAEPCSDQQALDFIFDKYKTQEKAKYEALEPFNKMLLSLSDSEITDKASRSEKFRSLYYNGNFQQFAGKDESGHHIADLSLCTILAFWTNRNQSQIDRIFRTSALYRQKWLRDDYRQTTLDLACELCSECLCEYKERKEAEEVNGYKKYFLQE